MAVTEPDPFLRRAACYLRDVPEPGWDAIRDRVRAAVHATARSGFPIRASRDLGRGVVDISDQALRSLLARALRRKFVCQPTRIAFSIEASILKAIDIDITGSYGTQLRDLGDDIRRTVMDTVRQVIDDLDDDGGTPFGPIDITITNVVEGDPLH